MITTIHVLGIKETDFKAIEMGAKTFETRNNVRDFHRGEFIRFVVTPDDLREAPYEVDDLYEITHVLKGFSLKDGFYAELGIRRREQPGTHE